MTRPDPADVREALTALDVLEQTNERHLPAADLQAARLRLRVVRDLLHNLTDTDTKENR